MVERDDENDDFHLRNNQKVIKKYQKFLNTHKVVRVLPAGVYVCTVFEFIIPLR